MLGDMLRAERERQGLSVKDIEKGTSIRALYIESIENGDFSQLPGEVYTKGFIRNYANFLKMDADAMVKRYMEENHPEKAAAQAEQEAAKEEAPVKAEPVKEKAPFTTVIRPRKLRLRCRLTHSRPRLRRPSSRQLRLRRRKRLRALRLWLNSVMPAGLR